jgi:AraC family transcriptional regulator
MNAAAQTLNVPTHNGLPTGARAGTLAEWQIERVQQFINDHLADTIRVKDLSHTTRLSCTHFSRMFRRTFGEPPYAYVIRQRATRAADILRQCNTALSDVAGSCGFSDQAHLSTVFRRIFGRSPGEWRRLQMVANATGEKQS